MTTLANKSSRPGIDQSAHHEQSSYANVARNPPQQPQQHPQQVQQQREEKKKKAFMQRMAEIADAKINDFVKKHFSHHTRAQMTMYDRLKIRKSGTNMAIQLMVSRWIDNVDWDLKPSECNAKVSKVLPIFGRLMTYCTKQQTLNQHTVKIDLVYDPDPRFTHESQMKNAEMFYLAVKELEKKVHQKHAQKDPQLLALNSRFAARAWQRRPIRSVRKYVMKGGYIAKQLKEGRKAALDIGINALHAIISEYIQDFQIYRLGGLQKDYISDVIIIETTMTLNIMELNAKHRRICNQRVWFSEFKKKKQKTKTEEEVIAKMQREEMTFGTKDAQQSQYEDHEDYDMTNNKEEKKDTEVKQQQETTKEVEPQRNSERPSCALCGEDGHRASNCSSAKKRSNEDKTRNLVPVDKDKPKQDQHRTYGVKRGGQGHRAYLNLQNINANSIKNTNKKRKGNEIGLEYIDPTSKRSKAKTTTALLHPDPTSWQKRMDRWKEDQYHKQEQEKEIQRQNETFD